MKRFVLEQKKIYSLNFSFTDTRTNLFINIAYSQNKVG